MTTRLLPNLSAPLLGLLLLVTLGMTHPDKKRSRSSADDTTANAVADSCALLYQSLSLEDAVSEKAFRQAYIGFSKIKNRSKEILTLIDFSKPSTEERLFVIDMAKGQLLYKSVCAHGRGSGSDMATAFSNKRGSHKSSIGFYLTESTYRGRNGYSLRLDGLERGFNDQARNRAIVVHGAKYANPELCRNGNRLGRSLGCPAIPEKLTRPIIDAIKGGSVLYIYANYSDYEKRSRILNG